MKFGFRRGRLGVAITAAAMVAVVLTACSGGPGTAKATQSTGAVGGTSVSGTINWWGWSPQPDVAQQYIAAFNKVYPNVHVNYKLLAIAAYPSALGPALQSSVGPDVFGIAPGQNVSQFGRYAEDMTPVLVKELGKDWKSKLTAAARTSLTTSSGKLVGLAIGLTYGGTLYVNDDMYAKYHVSIPTTFAGWVKGCKVFAKAGVQCFTQGAGDVGSNVDTLHTIANSIDPGYWAKAADGKTSWNDPTFVKALTTWKQMFTEGIMEKGALGLMRHPDAQNAFFSGKAASAQMGTWFMQYTERTSMSTAISAAGVSNPKPFPITSIPFPAVGSAKNSTLFGDADFGLAVNSKSKNKAAANLFASWLTTTTSGQQIIANALDDIPALVGVKPQWSAIDLVKSSTQEPNLKALFSQVAPVTDPRLANLGANTEQALGVAAATVAQGSATPAQAAATLAKSAKSAN
jgi:raffinose/stachyose/melibiose transport system substrate-binding protein